MELSADFKLVKGEIKPGDSYVNVRGAAPKVMVCDYIKGGAVYPLDGYPFDLCDVSKIEFVGPGRIS